MMTKSIILLNREKAISREDLIALVLRAVSSAHASSTPFWKSPASVSPFSCWILVARVGSSSVNLYRVGIKLLDTMVISPRKMTRKPTSTSREASPLGILRLSLSTGSKRSSVSSMDRKKTKANACMYQKASSRAVMAAPIIIEVLWFFHMGIISNIKQEMGLPLTGQPLGYEKADYFCNALRRSASSWAERSPAAGVMTA